ncbi:hypothetical protein [Maribellus maritimus]|uniref:hypothetical protein n=1 Tax=Maribellus maritimus TaxID=2870838 RepID=UPI001EEA3B06|nr:hypothetical protein [Maribellus maritimus]MCG6191563.1 hypothetical protein [Maribellus maritimus]
MRRYKFLILSILVALFSCNEDDFTPPPAISSEYYFSGIVNNDLVVINADEDNYQIYTGSSSNWNEPPIGKYDLGFNTYPFEIGDKHILIITPETEVTNKEKVLNLFPIGKLSDTDKEGFKLEYGKIIDKEEIETNIFHPIREKLIGEFSELEVVSVVEKSEDIYKIKMKFSCYLYDDKEILQGEINSAEIILRLVIHN